MDHGPQDSPDTAHSSAITDHHFVENEKEPWNVCVLCGLARAAHAHGPIPDTDPGRPLSMRLGERRSEIMEKTGHKDDSGKTNFFYLPWEALEDVAYVMEFG